MITKQRTLATFIAAAALMTIAGCPDFPTYPQLGDGSAKLTRFASPDELLNFLKGQISARQLATNSRGWAAGGGAPLAADLAAGDASGATQESSATDYSGTNIQETGVDEGDVVKTDGTYLYIARNNTLHIIKAVPADEMAEVGSLTLDVEIIEFYLNGSDIILLASVNGLIPLYDCTRMWPPYYTNRKLTVAQADVSDPTTPTVTKQVELDGSLVSSRLTAEQLVVVLAIVPKTPTDANPATIAALTLDDVLPVAKRGDEETPLVAWDQCYYPGDPDGYNMTAVVTLNAANIEQTLGSTMVVADAGTIYASTNALYVTDDGWTANDGYREFTTVHKFRLAAGEAAQYVGSGRVPGRLLNQFSLGEHEGNLRLATHVNGSGIFMEDLVGMATAMAGADETPSSRAQSRGPSNAVYVLGESDDGLKTLGSVEDIAPGENLYAARFIGKRGFVVTFEQIDPLFVLDLSDPTNPIVAGELEIPGYSDYLHPFGDDFLIGVGRSTIETQWGGAAPEALQLSLFDVSDLTQPTLVEQIKVGGYGSSSDVTATHKAFTFLPSANLLALPAQLTPDGTHYGEYVPPAFDGALCYRVSEAGFEELGRLAGVTDEPERDWYWHWNLWRRAVIIGDYVYALTTHGVSAAPLADFTSVSTFELTD